MDVMVVQVKAIHNFKGQNNDELCFKKGQVITVTQNDDQNWWEGTLDGNTGWFPANYVEPYKHKAGKDCISGGGTTAVAVSPSTDELYNRALVLRNILDSERQHITELTKLINSCLRPMGSHKLMCASEFTTLVFNLERIVSVHEELLSRLEGEGRKDSNEQRVGAVFLAMAAETLALPHRQYCAQHPRAVCYLQEHKCEINKYIENTSLCDDDSNNASSDSPQKLPGLLALTTYLSKPFRRLQQYPGLLQELYRHQHEAHRDRGDAHRAAKVMTDLAASCNALRRQKELELEVVTAHIEGWEQRGTLAVLGEVQAMGSVAVLPDHTDKYLVVFPLHLVLLAVSPKMSNFIFQAQYNLSDINCCKLEDCDQYKNAFELTGCKMERLVAVCQTKTDQQRWVDTFSQLNSSTSVQPPALPSKSGVGSLPAAASKGQTALVAGGSSKNSAPPGVVVCAAQSSTTVRPASHTAGVGTANLPNVPLTVTQLQQQPPLPPHKVPPKPVVTKGGAAAPVSAPTRAQAAASVGALPMSHGPNGSAVRQATVNHKTWSLCDLRPSPPLRPKQLKRARHIKKDERWHDEDSVILRVVEAYCASTAMRQSKSHDSASPGMGKRQDRSASQISSVVDERSLASAVTMLRAELSRLTQDHQQLRQQFEMEKSANMHLRTTIQRLMPHGK